MLRIQCEISVGVAHLRYHSGPGGGMSAETIEQGVREKPAVDRRPGLAVLGASLVVVVVLALGMRWTQDRTGQGYDSLYSNSCWVLLAVLFLVGVSMLVVRPTPDGVRSWAHGAGLVVGAQLAGIGIVALKHWRPWFGMTGAYRHLALLELFAGLLALAGLVVAVVCLWQLAAAKDLPVRTSGLARWAFVGLGVLVAAGLPWLLVDSAVAGSQMTTLGAAALMFSLPWGVTLGLCGWLRPNAMEGICSAIFVSVSAGIVGSPVGVLLFQDVSRAFALVLLAVLTTQVVSLGVSVVTRIRSGSSPG